MAAKSVMDAIREMLGRPGTPEAPAPVVAPVEAKDDYTLYTEIARSQQRLTEEMLTKSLHAAHEKQMRAMMDYYAPSDAPPCKPVHKVGCMCVDCGSGKTRPGQSDADAAATMRAEARARREHAKSLMHTMVYGTGLPLVAWPTAEEARKMGVIKGVRMPDGSLGDIAMIPAPLDHVVGAMERHPEIKEDLMTLQSKLAAARAKAPAARTSRENTDNHKIAEALVSKGVTAKVLTTALDAAEDAATGAIPAAEVLDQETFDEFDGAVTRYRSLDGKIKALEAKKAEVKVIITEIIEDVEHKTLLLDEWAVTKVAGAIRESLDRKKLLEAGVTVEQLEKGTVRKQSAGYVQVREIEAPAK